MAKTLADKQQALQAILIALRSEAGLRQIDLAGKLGRPQSFVSKYESGERRLDFIELAEVCAALQVPVSEFVRRFEKGTK